MMNHRSKFSLFYVPVVIPPNLTRVCELECASFVTKDSEQIVQKASNTKDILPFFVK